LRHSHMPMLSQENKIKQLVKRGFVVSFRRNLAPLPLEGLPLKV
jgi:hypothetical protein